MKRGLAYWESKRAPRIAALIGGYIQREGGIALDIGCGSGALAATLAPRFERVIGLDPVLRRGQAYANGSYFELVLGRAESLPVRSGGVDFVFSYGALHHTRLEASLAEIVRVTAPGGTAVVIDFCADTESSRRSPYVRAALAAFHGYRQSLGMVAAVRITAFRVSPAWLRHMRSDEFLTTEEFTTVCIKVLGNVQFAARVGQVVAVWHRTEAVDEH